MRQTAKCPDGHEVHLPTNKGELLVVCPKCSRKFEWKPSLKEYHPAQFAPLQNMLLRKSTFAVIAGAVGFLLGYLTHPTPNVPLQQAVISPITTQPPVVLAAVPGDVPHEVTNSSASIAAAETVQQLDHAATAPKEQPTTKAAVALALPLPPTGVMKYDKEINWHPTPQLSMSSRAGSGPHYVRILEAGTNAVVAQVFVRDGETCTIDLPGGYYLLHVASGSNWYGAEDLFGPETTYTMSQDVFNLAETTTSYIQWRAYLSGMAWQRPITKEHF